MSISAYLAAAESNTTETIAVRPEAYKLAEEVDNLFALAATFKASLSPWVSVLQMNSRTLYNAAVRLACGGHHAAIFPLLRTSFESACYGYLIADRPELAEIWVNRHKDDQALRRCKNAFNSAVSDCAKLLERKIVGSKKLLTELYQNSIDDGGHPNMRSVFRAMSLEDAGENIEVRLHSVEPHRVEYSLFCCAEIGLYTTWPMGGIEPIDQDFWIEATRVNELKDSLAALWGDAPDLQTEQVDPVG